VVVKSAEGRKKVQAAYQRDWFYTAPMYIVAYKNHAEEWVRKYDNKPHGDVDLSIAIEHLTLAATERGLGTCWVCAFDPKVLAAEIPQPEGWEAVAIIPLGHIAEDCPKTEKNRKSLSDIIETI
jgi:nitroreductase